MLGPQRKVVIGTCWAPKNRRSAACRGFGGAGLFVRFFAYSLKVGIVAPALSLFGLGHVIA